MKLSVGFRNPDKSASINCDLPTFTPMKKFFAIFQLICFCVYSFTYKTHYCYHLDSGERFHGDCQWERKALGFDKSEAQTHILPLRYYCLDVHKDKVVKKENTSFPSYQVDLHIVFATCFLLKSSISEETLSWQGTNFPIRAGPGLLANSLRGPPLV